MIWELDQRVAQWKQQRKQFRLEHNHDDREIMSMDLNKIADMREHAFFERRKQKVINKNSSDFQGEAGYEAPSRYQNGTGGYENDLPDF